MKNNKPTHKPMHKPMHKPIPKDNIDYVVLFAEELKKDNTLFEQQKKLIEAQLSGSSSLFKNMCAGEDFKTSAREYLRNVGLL